MKKSREALKAEFMEEAEILFDELLTWVEAFMIYRKARGLAKGTIRF